MKLFVALSTAKYFVIFGVTHISFGHDAVPQVLQQKPFIQCCLQLFGSNCLCSWHVCLLPGDESMSHLCFWQHLSFELMQCKDRSNAQNVIISSPCCGVGVRTFWKTFCDKFIEIHDFDWKYLEYFDLQSTRKQAIFTRTTVVIFRVNIALFATAAANNNKRRNKSLKEKLFCALYNFTKICSLPFLYCKLLNKMLQTAETLLPCKKHDKIQRIYPQKSCSDQSSTML